MKKFLIILSLIAVSFTSFAQDIVEWTPGGKGFWMGLNLAKNFNGKAVDDVEGPLNKARVILFEGAKSLGKSAADTGSYAVEHPIKSLIVAVATGYTVDKGFRENVNEEAERFFDKVFNVDKDDSDGFHYQFTITQSGNGTIDLTYDGDLDNINITQTGGGTIVIKPNGDSK